MLEVSSTVSTGFPGDGWEFIISLFGEEWSQQKQNKIIVPQKPKRWNSNLLLFQETVIVQFCFSGCCEKTFTIPICNYMRTINLPQKMYVSNK